jgi:hypothetical protein
MESQGIGGGGIDLMPAANTARDTTVHSTLSIPLSDLRSPKSTLKFVVFDPRLYARHSCKSEAMWVMDKVVLIEKLNEFDLYVKKKHK